MLALAIAVVYAMNCFWPAGIVAAMKRTVIAPGVVTPYISSGRPLGSVSVTRAVIVPSLAIAAEAILTVMPGRMKLIVFWSAACGRTYPLGPAIRTRSDALCATSGAATTANNRMPVMKDDLRG